MNGFYTDDELAKLGLGKLGVNLKISRKASFHGAGNIEIGDNVRIDDFCVLSGKIVLGSHIHIGCHGILLGGTEGIYVNDFSTTSFRVTVFARSDDFSGETLTNPQVFNEFRHNTTEKAVYIGKHVVVGTGSTVFPGVVLGEGVAVGAHSLVLKSTEPWGIYAGSPAKRLKERSDKLLEQEKEFLTKWNSMDWR